MNKHKGTRIQVYLRETDLKKLDEFKLLSNHQTRSDAIRMLIRGTPLIDRSFRETVSQLGKIGGLIKQEILKDNKEHDKTLLQEHLRKIQICVNECKEFLNGYNNN